MSEIMSHTDALEAYGTLEDPIDFGNALDRYSLIAENIHEPDRATIYRPTWQAVNCFSGIEQEQTEVSCFAEVTAAIAQKAKAIIA